MEKQEVTVGDLKMEIGEMVVRMLQLRKERDYYLSLLQNAQTINGEERSDNRTDPQVDLGGMMPKEM